MFTPSNQKQIGSVNSRSIEYRPDIDGLRAIAVLSVIFYHGHLGLQGGYVGVDVFFVISGYLITAIIVKKLEKNSFDYWEFWSRRVRRLIPALFATTLLTALASYFILLPKHLSDLGGALIAQPLLMVNVYFWRVVQDGYFGDPPEIRPLLHTWSLGIEEQFYVFFPLLLLYSARLRLPAKRMRMSLFILGSLSLMLCVLLTPIKAVASFFTLPTRAWELFAGGILVFQRKPGQRVASTASWLGSFLVGYSILCFSPSTPFPGAAAVLPVLGTSLLIWSGMAPRRTLLSSVLSTRPLVAIGLASYSLYLWHWPIISLADYLGLLTDTPQKWLAVSLSLSMGFLSWRYIETSSRYSNSLNSKRSALGISVLYLLTVCSIGMTFRFYNGFPGQWSTRAIGFSEYRNVSRTLKSTDVDLTKPEPPQYIGDLTAPKASFILWGDSHARALVPAFHQHGIDYGLKGIQFTKTATPAMVPPGNKKNNAEAWAARFSETVQKEEIETVFLATRWAKHNLTGTDFYENFMFLSGLGVQEIILIEDVPLIKYDPPRKLALKTRFRWLPTPFPSREEHYSESLGIRRALDEAETLVKPNVFTRIDPAPLILELGSPAYQDRLLYGDADHLTADGALFVAPVFEEWFKRNSISDATSTTNVGQEFSN